MHETRFISDIGRACGKRRITAQTGAEKGKKVNAVKGGSWNSKRTGCRTESREEGRAPNYGYGTVGFRVVREK